MKTTNIIYSYPCLLFYKAHPSPQICQVIFDCQINTCSRTRYGVHCNEATSYVAQPTTITAFRQVALDLFILKALFIIMRVYVVCQQISLSEISDILSIRDARAIRHTPLIPAADQPQILSTHFMSLQVGVSLSDPRRVRHHSTLSPGTTVALPPRIGKRPLTRVTYM